MVDLDLPPRARILASEVYGLLVIDRGWPSDRYERWLTEILIDQLLPPEAEASHEIFA